MFGFYGSRNSEVNTNESLSETDILSSGSDISDNESSDLYQPSSCNELIEDSSSPCSEDIDDEEMDRGAQNTESTTIDAQFIQAANPGKGYDDTDEGFAYDWKRAVRSTWTVDSQTKYL